MRIGEAGLGGGNENIAHQGELEAASDCKSIDSADEGYFQQVHGTAKIDHGCIRRFVTRARFATQFFKIETRCKGLPSPSQNDDFAGTVVGQVAEGGGQFGAKIKGKSVHDLGPIKGDFGDGTVTSAKYEVTRHRSTSIDAMCSTIIPTSSGMTGSERSWPSFGMISRCPLRTQLMMSSLADGSIKGSSSP